MSPLAPITLDRAAEVPLGTQLTWVLRARIATGELARGERLPGARELAATAGVNVNTVRAVFARLEEERLLRVVHGSGTFVAGPRADDAAQLAAAVTSEARRRGIDPREVAAALYVEASAPGAGDGGTAGERTGAPADDAATRRLLRAEIDELERALAGLRGAPSLAAQPPLPRTAGRLLSAAELAAQRDALAERLARARAARRGGPAAPGADDPAAGAAPAPAPARSTSTRRSTGAPRLRWVPGGS